MPPPTPPPTPSSVKNFSVAGTEDTTQVLTLDNFLSGYQQSDGAPLSEIRIESLPSNGALKFSGSTIAAGATVTRAQLTAGKLTFTPNADLNSEGTTFTFGFTAKSGGGAFISTPKVATVTVAAVNDAPVFTGASTTQPFGAGSGAKVIDSTMTFSDVDSVNLNAGTLTVQVTTNNTTDDRLAINNVGAGAGQIGFDGTNVTYGGTVIGTAAGGSGTTALTITFNANATPTAVENLARQVTYNNVNGTPNFTNDPVVSFIATDGDGGTSVAQTRTMDISSAATPVVQVKAGETGFLSGDGPVNIDPNLTVEDAQADYNGGFLRAAISANGETNDRLTVENQGTATGQIGFDGTNVTFAGTTIGTAAGGSGTTALTITLNASATNASVTALGKAIQYDSVSSDPTVANRTITFDVRDAASNNASSVTRTVSIDQTSESFSTSTPTQQALTFDGGDYLSLGSNAALINGTATTTWEGWINTSQTTGTQSIFSAGSLSTSTIISNNFSSDVGLSLSGSASVTGGVLQLTPETAGQVGQVMIATPATQDGARNFSSTFKLDIGDAELGDGADGLSFNYGAGGFINGASEEGLATGLAVTFDTWDNTNDNFGLLEVKVNGAVIATATAPTPGNNGPFRTNSNTFVPVEVSHTDSGLTVKFNGATLINNQSLGGTYNPQASHAFVLGARTGGAFDVHAVDDLVITMDDTLSTRSSLIVDGGNLKFLTEQAGAGTQTSRTTTSDSGIKVADGEWHHVAAVHDGTSTLKLYVDGVLSSTHTGVAKNISTGTAVIGSSSTGISDTFVGKIGEVRVWDTVRSDELINLNFEPNLTNPGTTTNLVGYWNMKDAAGQTVTDSSANSNNATLGATAGASTDDPSAATSTLPGFISSDWTVVEGTATQGGDSVLIQDGNAEITNRELLRSASQFDPTATDPLHVTGRFTFQETGDFFHVMTRAAGTGSSSNDGLPLTGVEFKADLNGNLIALNSYDNSATATGLTASGDAGIDLRIGAEYEFEVFDDGTNLKFSVVEIGNGENTASVTSTSSLNPTTNYVVVTNRHGVNETHRVAVDDLKLDHGFVTDEGTAVSGTLHAETATGTLTYSALANNAAANGTFTITNAATGAFTYTPNAGFHGADTIRYQVSGTNNNIDTRTLRINVKADTDVDVGGSSMKFDGGDYIDLATTGLNTGTGAFTYEMWVNTSSATAQELLNIGDTANNNSSDFHINSDGTLRINGKSGGALTSVNSGAVVNDGQWHHVAVSYDGAGYTHLFVDGAEVAEGALTTNVGSGAARLGQTITGTASFNGQMDEVRIWNTERSADDIRLNYDQQASGSETGLTAYYRFEETSDGTIIERAGANNTGTLGDSATLGDTAEPTLTNTAGKVLQLDGANDIVTVSNTSALNFGAGGSFTLEGWINTSSAATQQRVFFKGDGGGGQSYSLMVNSGKAHVRFDDGSGGRQAESAESVNDGAWHHIAGVFDNAANTLKIYIDGTLAATTTGITGSPVQASQPLDIGGISTGTVANSQYFNGQLDDLRVWNTARTDAEISSNYQQSLIGTQGGALVAHYTFDDGTANDSAGSNNGALTNGATTVNGIPDGKTPDIFGLVVNTKEDVTAHGNMVYDEVLSGTVSYHVLDGSSAEQTTYTNGNTGTLSIDSETGYWTFTPSSEFNGSTTFTLRAKGATSGTDDETITINVTAVPENSLGISDGVLQLDGVNDKVVSDGNITLTNHSMEMWINTTETTADRGYLGTDDSTGDVAQMLSNGDGTWRVEVSPNAAGGAGTFKTYSSSKVINDGQWHHIAYTYDASGTGTLKLYVDGAEDTSVTKTLDNNQTGFSVTDKLQIGVDRGQSFFADGQIDEVRVWSDVRTAQEISANYQNQIDGTVPTELTAYYRFDDESTAGKVQNLGSGGNTLDATITGAKVVNTLGRALNFDGTDDVLNIVDGNKFDTTSYTIETWVQLDAVTNTTIIARTDSGGIGGTYSNALFVDGSGKLSTYVFNGAQQHLNGTITAKAGQWYHLASVYDADTDTLKLYVDGQLDAIKTGVAAIFSGGDRYQTGPTGSASIASGKFDGRMGELRIWGDVRTDQEIADNYNQTLDASQHADLLAHYTFDEQSGTSVPDDAGAINGALTGSPTWVSTAPTVWGTEVTVQENQNATGTMSTNEVAGTVTYSVKTAANNGTVSIDGDGDWFYTPKENFHGSDTFTLRAVGSTNGDDSETITVTVNDVTHNSINVSEGALQIDGLNDGTLQNVTGTLTTTDAAKKISNQMTMEMWVNFLDATSQQNPLRVGDSVGSANRFVMEKYADQSIHFFLGSDGAWTSVASGFKVSADTWYHISMSYDGTTAKIYVDGNLVQSQAVSGVSLDVNAAQTLIIGSDTSGFSSKALIDDVRIWNDVRTADEIKSTFDQQLTGTEANLQAYYRFDDQSEAGKVQNLGLLGNGADGTLNNGSEIINLPQTALHFDGSTGYIDAGRGANNELAITGDLTVESWIKMDTLKLQDILSFAKPQILAEAAAVNALYEVKVNAGGDIVYIHENGSGVNTSITFNTNLVADQWYHVALVRNTTANTVKVLIDGTVVDVGGYTNDPDSGASSTLHIGTEALGTALTDKFDGQMSDIRIWNTARTDQEIADNFNETLVGDQGNALVLNYKFEDQQGIAVTDSAGANNGTITGTATYVETGPDVLGDKLTVQENQSVSGFVEANDIVQSVLDIASPGVDGVATALRADFTDFPTTALSMEMWVNPDALGGELFSYAVTGSANEFLVTTGADGSLNTWVNGVSNSFTGPKLQIGEWSHVTVTWDSVGGALKLYIDGTLASTKTASTAAIGTAGTVYLGNDQDSVGGGFQNNGAYDGQMSEVRVWSDVRSAAEVAANFNKELVGNEAGLKAYWQLNEGSGTTAIDKTGNHNGTYEQASTGFISDIPTAPVLPLTNDGTTFSVTGAGSVDADGKVTATTTNGGTVTVDTVSGEYTYTPALNYNGTDTFVVTAVGDGNTGITDSETITVTVKAESHDSINVSGGGLLLDGVNDYVTLTNGAMTGGLTTSQSWSGTIEAWVLLDTNTGEIITGKQHDGINTVGVFSIGESVTNLGATTNGTDGKLYFHADNQVANASSNSVIPTGEWHHVAVSFNSSEARFYIDGNLDNVVAGDYSVLNPTGTGVEALGGLVGNSGIPNLPFDGKMDDVRIWNDVRTDQEIRDNYDQQLIGSETNLNAYYRFDDNDLGTTAEDQTSNNYHGTLTDGASISTVTGKALSFDGTNDFVDLGSPAALLPGTGDFSYEAWIKTSDATNNQYVLASGNTTSSTLFFVTGGKIALHNPASTGPTGTTTVADGKWHHVAVTHAGGAVRLYVDGELDGTGTSSFNVTAGSATIGKSAFGQFFNGEIADVRVWGDVRTDNEIKTNFQSPLSASADNLTAHYNFDDPSTTAVTDVSGGSLNGTISGATKVNSTAPIEGPSVLGNAIETTTGTATSGIMQANDISGTMTFSKTNGGNGTVTVDSDTGEWTYTPNANYIGSDSFTLTATGGTGNPETETITVSVTARDRVNVHDGGLQLDGANDYVALANNANSLDIGRSGTIETWITKETWNVTNEQIISSGIASSGNDTMYLNLQTNAGLHFRYGAGTQNGDVFVNYLEANNFVSGSSHHVAVTWEASGNNTLLKMYVDGAQVSTATTTNNFNITNASPTWLLGKQTTAATTELLNGQLDDVRVWNTTRTASEIELNYDQRLAGTETGLKAYYRFDDQIEATKVQDGTSNNNDGTLTNGASIFSGPDRALSFDGIDDVVTIANNTNMNAAQGTWAVWVKTDGSWGVNNEASGTGGKGFAAVMGRASTGISENGVNLLLSTSGNVVLNSKDATGVAAEVSSTTSVTDGNWHYIAVSYDQANGGAQKVYVDGVLEATGASSRAWTFAGQDLTIGKSIDTYWEEFEGELANVQIYNKHLTDAEIAENYRDVPAPGTSGLIGLYEFDETTGTTAANTSTSASKVGDGTIAGAVSVDTSPDIFGNAIVIQEDQSATGLFEANAASFEVNANGSNGAVVIDSSSGLWTYTPNDNFYGSDTFTLRATGHDGITHDEAMTVTVNRVDTASVNVSGGAAQFDGVNDFVAVADSASLDITGDLTLEVWVNPEGAGSHNPEGGMIVGKDNSYLLARAQDGSIKVALNGTSGTWAWSDTGYDAPLDTWTHISVAFDASARTIHTYANGDLVGVNTNGFIPSDLTASNEQLQIGSRSTTNQFFDGQIDDVRVWNSVRTAEQIRDNYDQQLTGSETNLQAYYRFDGDVAGSEVRDLTSNGNHGTLTNGADLVPNLEGGLRFDGGDFVDLGTDAAFATNNNDFTWEGWINTSSTARQQVLSVGELTAGKGASFYVGTDGKLHFDLSSVVGPTSATAVNDGNWHHVSVVKSGNSYQLYVNGATDGNSATLSAANITTGNVVIGSVFSKDSSFFNGQMSDVRMWSTARTATELTENMYQTLDGTQTGLVANYTMDEVVGGQIIDSAGTAQNGTLGASTATGTDDPTLIDLNPAILGTHVTTAQDQNASGVMTANDVVGATPTFYVLDGASAQQATFTTANGGKVTVDQSSGAWTYDPSTTFTGTDTFKLRASDGTRNDDETISVTVRDDDLVNVHGGALQLDGVNDYVDLADVSGLSGAYTIETWVNVARLGTGQGYPRFVELAQGREADDNIYLGLNSTTGKIELGNFIGTTGTSIRTSGQVTLNEWVHVAAVNNGDGTGAIYLNGVAQALEGNTTDFGAGSAVTRTSNYIGRSNFAADNFLKGSIDEVRVWSDARTAQEILDNMDQQITTNDAGLVLNFHFDDDPEGTTVTDSAGTAQNGTLFGEGQVLSLDGTGDYMTVGNPSAIDFAAALTIEGWVKTTATGANQDIVNKTASNNWVAGAKALSLSTAGKLQFDAHGSAPIIATTAINDGQWHHFAISIAEGGGSDTLKFYIDGALETISSGAGAGTSSATIARVADVGGHVVNIGALGGLNQNFNGQMDDIRIWSDVRTQAEIQANMSTTLAGNEAGLNRYYDFDRDFGTTVDDKVNTANTTTDGTLTGNAAVVSVNDAPTTSDDGPNIINTLGGALDFDGSSTYINAGRGGGNELAISGDLTMETWVKFDAISGTQALFDFAHPNEAQADNVLYQLGLTSGGDLEYAHESGSGANSTQIIANTNLVANQWYHVAVTRNVSSNLIKTYVDGVLISSDLYSTADPDGGGNSELIIAANGAGGSIGTNKLNGKMSDVRIWKTARTDAEIADNYNQELTGNQGGNLVLNYKLNETSGSALTDSSGTITGKSVTGTATWADTAPDVYGTTVSVMENDAASGRFEADSSSFSVTTAATNGTAEIDAATGAWTYTPNADFFGTDTFTLLAGGAGSETITVTVNNRVQDSVDISGGVAQFSRTPANSSVQGTGHLDRLTADLGTTTFTNKVTLEAMVQFNDLTTGTQQSVFSLFGQTNNNFFTFYKETNNALTMYAVGSASVNLVSDVTASADTWYHVAATYDGTTLKFYVDGNLIAQGAATIDLNNNAQLAKLVLGGSQLANTSTSPAGIEFDGMIDEMRVWNDVRTEEEIRANLDQQLSGSETNLQAYYRFDDDGSDHVTDYSGNSRHATSANGRVLTLDGAGDYVTVANSSALQLTTSATFEAWFNVSRKMAAGNNADDHGLITKGNGDYALFIGAPSRSAGAGTLIFGGRDGSNAFQQIEGSAVVDDGRWHHAAVTFDGGTVKLYVDGILDKSGSVALTSLKVTTGIVEIGAFTQSSNKYLSGQMDDVRIWDDVRTHAEIQANMHEGIGGGSPNLVAYYTFEDDDSGATPTIQDVSGSATTHNGVGVGNAAISATTSNPINSGVEIIHLPTKALNLDGANDYVTVPNLGVTFQDMTIETWINLDSLPADNDFDMLLGNAVHAAAGDLHIQFQSVSGVKQLNWGESGNHLVFAHEFAQDIGDWLHISVVRDVSANQLHLYLNGDLTETITYTSESAITLDDAQIGALGGASRFLDGQLSDFRIWQAARTGAEIQQTYNQTLTGNEGGDLVVNYVMDEVVGTSLTDEAGSNSAGTVSGGATVVSVAPAVYGNTITINEGETATGTMTNSDVQGTASYAITSNPAQGSVSVDSSSGQWTYTPPENYAGSVSFNVRASGATSGTDTETITVTIAADAENAVHGGAIQFDGINDTVVVSPSTSLTFGTGDFSVEAWINLDQVGINQAVIDNRGDNNFLGYLLAVNSSNQLQVGFSDGADGATITQAGTTALAADTWYHVAATFDRNGNATLYVNGTAEGTASIAGEAGAIGTQDIQIGGESAASGTAFSNFMGMMDEVRFWNDVRTAQEIGDNYNEQIDPSSAGLVANYRFDEATGSVVQDSTANNNDGVINGPGSPTDVLTLDGINDYVDLGTNAAFTTGSSDFTIEAWIQTSYTGARQEIFSFGNGTVAANDAGFFYVDQTTGNLRYGQTSAFGPTGGNVADGAWHHVAVTNTSGTMQLYVDGVASGASQVMSPAITTGVANIGRAMSNSSFHFNGQMDEVRFWNDARTGAELNEFMNQKISGAPSNLVANYSFDSDSQGASGTIDNTQGTAALDGTRVNGASVNPDQTAPLQTDTDIISGPTGNVLSLPGGWPNVVSFGNASELNVTGAATYEAWVRPDALTGVQQIIVGNYRADNATGYALYLGSDNKFGFIAPTAGGTGTITATNTATAGQWYHVVGVYTGSAVKLYIDGDFQGQSTGLSGNISHSGASHMIGGSPLGTLTFNGAVDNLRVWNVERTAAEVRDGMTGAYDYDTTDLIAQYTFDDVSGTTIRDNTTIQTNGTIASSAKIVDSGSGDAQIVNHLGNALSFDGTNDNVAFSSGVGPTGSAARTIMLWAKTTSDTDQTLASYGNSSGTGTAFALGLNNWDTSGGGHGVTAHLGNAAITFTPLTATNDGQWHHYAVVVPGSAADGTVSLRDLELYQDGHRLTTISALFSNDDRAINTGGGNLNLGSWFNASTFFNGSMSEASVWSTALTAGQISDYMTTSLGGDETGLSGYWKLNEGTGQTVADSSVNSNSGTLGSSTAVATDDPTWHSNAPTLEGSFLNIAEGSSASGHMTSADVSGTATYTAIGSPQNGDLDLDAATGQWTYTPNDNYQGADSFTIRASGATSGVDDETVSVDVGKDPTLSTDYSLNFDGNNDVVAISDVTNIGTSALSVELWMKTTGASETMFSYAVTEPGNVLSAHEAAFHTSGSTLIFTANNATGASLTNAGVTDGAWHHVAATYDGTSTRLYVDGALKTTGTGASGTLTAGGTIVLGQDQSAVGGSFQAGNAFAGEMNGVRVWDTVRTDAEITANYDKQLNGDETGLVGNWQFDEGSGAIAEDTSGNDNDGAITDGASYKDLTTVAVSQGATYKGMILGEDVDGDGLSYSLSGLANGTGSLVVDGDTYTYVNNNVSDHDDSFNVTITDDNGDQTTETISFVVT